RPLAILRIGLAGVLLMQALALLGSLQAFHGEHGLVQWSVTIKLVPGSMPRLAEVASALRPCGISGNVCVQGAFLAYVAGLAALLVGWQTRLAAALACLTRLALMTRGPASVCAAASVVQIRRFFWPRVPAGAGHA